MAEDDQKKYPISTEGVRNLLGMDDPNADESEPTRDETTVAPPADLPFLEIEEPVPTTYTKPNVPAEPVHPLGAPAPAGATGPIDQLVVPAQRKGGELYGLLLWTVKNVLPYVVIFAIGLGLYFFFFSSFSFNSLLNRNQLKLESVTQGKQDKDLANLKNQLQGEYLSWMKQFFFDVNDDAILSMDADVSGNGLTNFEKYLLNLNPKVFSTRGSMGDGEAVIEGINPWTGKPFTDEQKKLVDTYINKELISNRITAAALSRGQTKFAQYVSSDSPYYIDPSTLQKAGATSDQQVITSPEVLNNQQAYTASQSAGGVSPIASSQIDTSVNGRLDIPDNKISVPLIWTSDVKNFDNDLKKGIVHYPGTPFPGETGTSYISGHSSGYLWDHSPYKQIFAGLGNVKDGASFTIAAKQRDGKDVLFHYVVQRRGEFVANDQAQFVSTADSIVALSTCWPVNTTDHRLVLFGKLTQTERSQ